MRLNVCSRETTIMKKLNKSGNRELADGTVKGMEVRVV